MTEHDFEKLLGGFAADTLTPEEKQQLYNKTRGPFSDEGERPSMWR